jgi:hypothetical protein
MGKSSERQLLGGLNVPYSTLIPYFQQKDERMFAKEHPQALWLAFRPTPSLSLLVRKAWKTPVYILAMTANTCRKTVKSALR